MNGTNHKPYQKGRRTLLYDGLFDMCNLGKVSSKFPSGGRDVEQKPDRIFGWNPAQVFGCVWALHRVQKQYYPPDVPD